MKPVLSREEMRRFDAQASSVGRVPSLLLMENAGRGAADAIAARFRVAGKRALVVCGAGNNGGDGFVVARRLLALGAHVELVALSPLDRLKGDALTNAEAFRGVGGVITHVAGPELTALDQALGAADFVVDALFGTGLARPIEGLLANAVESINAAERPCFALDIPSGLDSDTGQTLGVAIRAASTITFGHPKRGLLTPNGVLHSGEVVVVDIGVPPVLAENTGYGAELIEPKDALKAFGKRGAAAHKGASGRVLVLAGSPGKIGAALLVAHGALRAGAGLVTLGARPEAASALELRVLEAMTLRIDPSAPDASLAPALEAADTVAIGPGFGLDEEARRIVRHVVLEWDGVKIIDADAITAFEDDASELGRAAGSLVLTPHPGEMGRLLGIGATEVEADRFGAVERAVELTRATVLLKGAHTLIGSPGHRIAIGARGSSVLATGGAGDVLCGILAACAVTAPPRDAACAAAYLHAKSGELWATRRGGPDRGLLAHEIADSLPEALAELARGPDVLTS
jgi:NAD(P)H-hydrate epimerase